MNGFPACSVFEELRNQYQPSAHSVLGLLLLLGSAGLLRAEEKAMKPANTPQNATSTFTVEEVSGIERPAWPVTFGMPFAQGQLKGAEGVKVTSADGKPVPSVARVAARWRDGSVKWLHLDCQVDLHKNGKEEFKLAVAAPSTVSKGPELLRVTKTNDGVTVDTGSISFALTPSGGGVPQDVKLAGGTVISKGGTHTLSFVETAPPPNPPELRGNWKRPVPDGATATELSAANTKAEVLIEQQSALAVTVLVRGWYEGGGHKACKFDVRVTAFAGKPYLKIQHTLTYTEDPDKFFVSGLNYGFGFEGADKARFGGAAGGSAVHEAHPEKSCYLLAPGPEINHNGILIADAPKTFTAYDVYEAGTAIAGASGKEPAGWLSINNAQGGLAVAVRDFRLLHPKELGADVHGINVGLWAPHAKLLVDCRNPRYGERIRGETTLNGCGCGWAKTHEIWVAYHDAKGQSQALDAVRAGQEPAYGIPDPKLVCDSGAMGMLAPVDRKNYPGMERQHDTFWAWLLRNQEVYRWDGFFNFGGILIEYGNHRERYSNGPPESWCWRDYAGWILNDGQIGHQAWRAFARSGDRRLIKLAEEIARNIGDESTIHYFNPKVPHAHPVGGAHRHDMSPWGTIITTYSMDVLGNCDLWYFTGDLRARDILRDYAENLGPGGKGLVEAHSVASLVARISEALDDPKLLEDAKKLVKRDVDEATNMVGFRSWTDCHLPMILAMDIFPGDELQKAMLSVADKFVEGAKFPYLDADYVIHPAELLSWAYLKTNDKKYLPTLSSYMRKFGQLETAAAHEGDPYSEDWPALRKRMNEMPHGVVKVYINMIRVGRYPAVVRALHAAGMTEKEALTAGPGSP